MQVLSAYKGRGIADGSTLVVRRPGGKVSIEGGTVIARDPDFPPFQVGEEYLLFLDRGADGALAVSHGAQGAFKIESAKVTQVSSDTGTWNRARGAVGVLAFLEEVAAAVKRN